MWFIHDNAAIHTAKKVKAWFEEQRVAVQDWASYSPDMNPIEHVWKALKELVAKMYPEVMKNNSESDEARTELEEALQSAWNALPDCRTVTVTQGTYVIIWGVKSDHLSCGNYRLYRQDAA